MSFPALWLVTVCILQLVSAESPKIIVVGAGASGIAATAKLLENGINDIVVLEAENRIGGRIFSTPLGGQITDLGAQWIYGFTSPVFELTHSLGVIEPSLFNDLETDELVFYNGDKLQLDSKVITSILEVLYYIFQDEADEMVHFEGSLNEFMTKRFNEIIKGNFSDIAVQKFIKPTLRWYNEETNSVFGAVNYDDISIENILDDDDRNDYNASHFKGKGFKTLLDILMKKIPDPSKQLPVEKKILLDKEVTKINWKNDDNTVIVECKDGSKFSADHVIVTVSLGVLKKNHESMFVPQLPKKLKTAINEMEIGFIEKVILEYPTSWWGNFSNGFELLIEKEQENKILTDVGGSKDKNSWLLGVTTIWPTEYEKNTISAIVSGKYALMMAELSDEDVKDTFSKYIKYFFGDTFTIPEPTGFLRSNWASNPHFLGSGAYQTLGTVKAGITANDLSKPISNDNNIVVLFAGEATSVGQMGSVCGALESGWREAKRIIDMYNKV